MVLLTLVVGAVVGAAVTGTVAVTVGSRDSARHRVEWREHAHAVRERNRMREEERLSRFDAAGPLVPGPLVPEPRRGPEAPGATARFEESKEPEEPEESGAPGIVLPRQRTGDTGPIPAPR